MFIRVVFFTTFTQYEQQYQERITNFERPYQIDYSIESSKPLPVRHDLGEIRLSEEGEFTRVVWVSKGHIQIPLLGNLLFDKLFLYCS